MSIILKATGHMTRWGVLLGLTLGTVYATVFGIFSGAGLFALFAGFYGALFGTIAGFGSGLVVGFALGAVTWVFFDPLTDAVRYRWTVALLCPALVAAAALIGFSMLFSGVRDWFFTSIPAVIAAGAAYYATQRFADDYTGEKPKNKKTKRDEIYSASDHVS